MTYTEALCEEGLVTDWRQRYHHDHGEQARKGDDLIGLKDCGKLWLGLVDLTQKSEKRHYCHSKQKESAGADVSR